MRKSIVSALAFASCFSISGICLADADGFDYPNVATCKSAMTKYQESAEQYWEKAEPFTPDWSAWNAERMVFQGFIHSESAQIVCDGKSCTYSSSMSCDFVEVLKPNWAKVTKQIKPIFDAAINQDLPHGKYTTGFMNISQGIARPISMILTCTYPVNTPPDQQWKSCEVTKQ